TPHFTARFISKSRLETLAVHRTSARFRLHPDPDDPILNGPYARSCRDNTCASYKGMLAALPQLIDGLPWAEVNDVACAARGSPYCEWQLHWRAPPKVLRWGLFVGGLTGGIGGAIAIASDAHTSW